MKPRTTSSPDRGLAYRAVDSGLSVSSAAIVQTLLRLIVISLLARLLGPVDFGLAAAAVVVLSFFRILFQVGVRPPIIQLPVLEERHLRAAFCASVAMGLGVSALIWRFADQIARVAFDMPDLAPLLRVMALMPILQSLSTVAEGLHERELSFARLVRLEIGAYSFGYGLVGLGMAFAGFGAWALVAAYLSQQALLTAGLLLSRPHPMAPRRDTAPALREIAASGGGFTAAGLANWAALQGGHWVAGRFLGAASLGIFKYAFDLTSHASNLFARILDRVLFPTMARVQGDPARLALAYRHGVGLLAIIVFPLAAVLCTLAPEIIELLLGDAWRGVVAPFQVLSLALLVRTTTRVSDALARGTGAVYRRAWRQAIYAASVWVLAWVGQHWGVIGLSVGVTGGMVANFLLMTALSVSLSRLSWSRILRSHLGALPSLLVMGGALLSTATWGRQLDLHPALILASSLAVGALVLLAALRIAPTPLLGRDGVGALRVLGEFLRERFPGLSESKWAHRCARLMLSADITGRP